MPLSVLKIARQVLSLEAKGILDLKSRLNSAFEQTIKLILESPGKVITTGVGKSGHVARKIMSTFASTGTTAFFLHPVEAMHGDLGIVAKDDVVLAISYSGQTHELITLIPVLKDHGAKIVAMTGGIRSDLARLADLVIDCRVEREACPLNLAPTTSSTATLAMGDALAVVLIEKRHFNADDFKRHHPSGNLGQRLSLKVKEVMFIKKYVPVIHPKASLQEAIIAIDKGDLGTVLITSKRRVLCGIYTDGDVRRAVLQGLDMVGNKVATVMTKNPKTVGPETLAVDALTLMEQKEITVLPIVDEKHRVLGIIHLHDLLGRGQISFHNIANRDKKD